MFQFLTDYLLQYRKVYIPSVGTFYLRQAPAELDFASRLIHPPRFTVEITKESELSDEQIDFLALHLKSEKEQVLAELNSFGAALKAAMKKTAFNWRGIGTLEYLGSHISLHNEYDTLLTPIPAHRVLHEDASHTVLQGEVELSSEKAAQQMHVEPGKKLDWLTWGLWILAAIALVFIIYHFYREGFNITSSGSQNRIGFSSW